MSKKKTSWRVSSDARTYEDTSDLDEVVIKNWFHLERIATTRWILRIGENNFYIRSIGKDKAQVIDVT